MKISFFCFCSLMCLNTVVAQIESASDEYFGLHASYSNGHSTVGRIDRGLQFEWGGASPDSRLQLGDFQAEWEGQLLVQTAGTYQFHVWVEGDAQIVVGGQTVLSSGDTIGMVSGPPVELSAVDQQIQVQYRTPQQSDKPRAALKVFWSSDRFTLEPLAGRFLYRNEPSLAADINQGQKLADSFRCAACHVDQSGLETLAAPSLKQVRSSSYESVVKRLMDPIRVVAGSHMPSFDVDAEQAGDIAAFLSSQAAQSVLKTDGRQFDKADVGQGRVLLHSLGCAACHNVGSNPAGEGDAYDGPELHTVGQRRTRVWIQRWLENPSSLNSSHRMPKVELSADERLNIAAALSQTDKVAEWPKFDERQIASGRQLVEKFQCVACHEIDGLSQSIHKSPIVNVDSADSCLRALSASSDRPYFKLKPAEVAAVERWYSQPQMSEIGESDRGHIMMQRNGCFSCHDRNTSQGISAVASNLSQSLSELKGKSQSLIPPSLTAVGDKLTDEYLSSAIAGRQQSKRLPWLMVRMPEYDHSAKDRAAILRHLKASDRIPNAADDLRADILLQSQFPVKKATDKQLFLGNQLSGANGYNCVACHQAGKFEPRNVALGTRGSDLMTMSQRIRGRYFFRWMKNPIRVVAGIEMPAYQKAVPGVLNDSLPDQLSTLWTAFHDRRFQPPTVTSRFEQVVNVPGDSSPVVLRDVFTVLDDKQDVGIGRAFAVGFSNGHSLLLNLDNLQLVQWTVGEFARQRTEGKSWFWDLSGRSVGRFQSLPKVVLMTADELTTKPVVDEGRTFELQSYQTIGRTVVIEGRFYVGPQSLPDPNPHSHQTAWRQNGVQPVNIRLTLAEVDGSSSTSGVQATITSESDGWTAKWLTPERSLEMSEASLKLSADRCVLTTTETFRNATAKPPEVLTTAQADITSVPGFTGRRLALPANIMPTALAWDDQRRLLMTSLRGDVLRSEAAFHSDRPMALTAFAHGLAAPYGIVAEGDDVIVSHKPEVLRLSDSDKDGRADKVSVVGSGWGYNDNYHDWTAGLVKGPDGRFYVGLGSDYSQKQRPENQDRWRGAVVAVKEGGPVEPVSMSMRYPMSLAFDDAGNLFATDNQGVQNTFNEINHLEVGRHYGVPSRHDLTDHLQHETPAINLPHPWSRSVNSIMFLPNDFPVLALRGHGIGCEYDNRFLIRFTTQQVDGIIQGASYPFSRSVQASTESNFVGPISCGVSPAGEIVIGSIWDSGWQGGRNTGAIEVLKPDVADFPNGIREVRVIAGGFEVEFFQLENSATTTDPGQWSVVRYTRRWKGGYGTPDTDRDTCEIGSASQSAKTVRLEVADLKPGFVYEIRYVGGPQKASLWPTEAFYSLKAVPR